MAEICVFAGTTEGRHLLTFLKDQPIKVYASVATEYGETLVPHAGNIEISARRLEQPAMEALFVEHAFEVVIDATHPHAMQVSECVATACENTGVEYLRLNREDAQMHEDIVYVDSIQAAADYLQTHLGTVLLATGSKELAPYTSVADYKNRFYTRVLPMHASLEACEVHGFAPSHIIAMQGPFTVEMNVALLKSIGADYLVTKDSGKSGGFQDKLEAARLSGAKCIVIGRPEQRQGRSYAETVAWLIQRYALSNVREVAIVGIGMGNAETMTLEADHALRDCECVIGASRMLEAVSHYAKPSFSEIMPAKIAQCMDAHPEYRRFAVVMSGDTGFFSGTKKLLPLLVGDHVRIISGLSSLQYLCSKLRTNWDDAHVLSLHGRDGSVVPMLQEHGKVFVLLDGRDAIRRICADLCDAGMQETIVSVGERLSYADECITTERADEMLDREFAPLSVALLECAVVSQIIPIGMSDEAFIRQMGEGVKTVPMTKSEVRAVSIAKLMLTDDALVYDIGAGTGSVSVEMAKLCTKGQIYALECRADASELIRLNAQKFALRNLTIIEGVAPEGIADLPIPTHAFIGGSSGNMREIIAALLKKNPLMRIVINAIALESIAETMQIIHEFGFDDAEVTQLSVARSRAVGRYHLMNALNPIWIVALQRNAKEGENPHEDRT